METIDRAPPFPDRPPDAHKGMVGRILVIGGRADAFVMLGAPALTANAALRTGAGLVQIATVPAAAIHVGLLAPCATVRPLGHGDEHRLAELADEFQADVVAIGPGLPPTVSAEDIHRLMIDFRGPLVVDADGLNTLASAGEWQAPRPGQVILTPHPGEMKRLLGDQEIDCDPTARINAAKNLSSATNSLVVYKGAGTVVTDGRRIFVNTTGNSGMATAGAGDVLTGVIAGLLGQRLNLFDATVLAVYLHGLAGDFVARRMNQASIIATDLIDALPAAISAHCGH